MDVKNLQLQTEKFLSCYSSEIELSKDVSLDAKLVHKENVENVLIGNVMEHDFAFATDGFEEVKFYTCIGRPNLKCNFIFDHPQDHYPLMLLMEMGRQMAISISHLYKNIPFKSCRNTVDQMYFKVFDFVELDLPLVIGCIDKVTKNKPNIQIREMVFQFYQNGRKCCESQSAVSIMSVEIYERYRLNSRRTAMGNQTEFFLKNNEHILAEQMSRNTNFFEI